MVKKAAKPLPETCTICAENLNQSNHKVVRCQFCEFEACRTCCQTFLCTVVEPRCMNNACNKRWTQKFLTENMTQTFMKTAYKEHRERVFYESEMSLMPATQLVIERTKYQDGLREQIADIQATIYQLVNERERLRRIIVLDVHQPEEEEAQRRAFVRRCGDGECRGFLSTAWKCGICDKRTCKTCHVVLPKRPENALQRDDDANEEETVDPDHTCKAEDVETARLLKTDSKTCPKCAVVIFKIDGCDQMWCTQCHTAFSWRTGQIQTRVHNPHYYEWLRQNGGMDRDPLDFQCGRELHPHMVSRRLLDGDPTTMSMFYRILSASIHVREVEMPRTRVDPVVSCQPLRIQYIKGQMTEQEFRVQVQRLHKKHEKKREIFDVLTVYIQSATDILFRFGELVREQGDKGIQLLRVGNQAGYDEMVRERSRLLDEVRVLVDYCNGCFEDIGKMFQGKPRVLRWPVPQNNYMFFGRE
jgi:hypothetical protein